MDAPTEIKGGNARPFRVLIGEQEAGVEYFEPSADAVVLLEPDGAGGMRSVGGDGWLPIEGSVGEHIQQTESEWADYRDLSTFGRAMADAATMIDTDAITRRQAECVALLDIHGASPAQAARWLGLANQTVQNHASRGREAIDGARELIDFVEG